MRGGCDVSCGGQIDKAGCEGMASLNYTTCDKPGINGTFNGELEGEYAMWQKKTSRGRTKKWCR